MNSDSLCEKKLDFLGELEMVECQCDVNLVEISISELPICLFRSSQLRFEIRYEECFKRRYIKFMPMSLMVLVDS